MSSEIKYKTKQMQELLNYLASCQGKHLTAGEIVDHFEKEGIAVGTTTVYRNLDRLVKEGKVLKYRVSGSKSACFEYIGEEDHEPGNQCFHCKCEKCGKLLHLHCEEVPNLGAHILDHHDFQMNSMRTVFYGICGECRAKLNNDED